MAWTEGAKTIDFLLGRNRLERIAPGGLYAATAALLERATKRLATARGALAAEDFDGAFTNAYDVYRMSGEALLLLQGLRATGGDGSHVTVGDSVCAQFSGEVDDFTKAIFERFRQGRHAAQYFDPAKAEKTKADAEWALATADRTLRQAVALVADGTLGPYWGSRPPTTIGTIGREVTVSWNEPSPGANHPGSRMVTCTSRPSFRDARAVASKSSFRSGSPRTSRSRSFTARSPSCPANRAAHEPNR